jgi:hypothetical protein
MSYLQSAIEYADEWLEFDPTKSRYKIKEAEAAIIDNNVINMEKEGPEILADKDKTNFITQINNRFMSLP